MTKRAALPTSITLAHMELQTLADLTRREQSAFDFWKQALRARGLEIPRKTVLEVTPRAFGAFHLQWHPAALGPKALAESRKYRQLSEQKEREFSARLVRKCLEVWI